MDDAASVSSPSSGFLSGTGTTPRPTDVQAEENEGERAASQGQPLSLSSTAPTVKIKLVPFNIPPHRRLQTTIVIVWGCILPICLFLFFYLLSIPPTWPILITYLIWTGFDTAPIKGARPSGWVRRWWIWELLAGYFPISLVKTTDLPTDRKYVFGYHPHGIIGVGAIANFGTEATGFSQLFPGLTPHLLTLTTNFRLPFYRDILMALGISSVSYRSCQNILRRGPGATLTIVVGGAAESLSAHPGTADLTLRRRLGFIKLAIREGADLVPVFSFGENDIFAQLANPKGTKLYTVQRKFQSMFGFTLPIFHGRGILNYTIGFLPYRHPIVSVVGRPIRVEQSDKPTMEQMQDVQKRTYWKLITGIKPSKLKLTKHDENLSSTFLESFPEFSDDEHLRLIKDEDLKTVDMKNRWREYMKQWEKVIGDCQPLRFGNMLKV
ncbi:MAG: diacylglycerol O-acyltransferase 1 [Cyphobasidiales sp. Tagirdzhanova-0007]|nr:MAG: diacylglycerol O-acyltransferase 1 [Cyphobasidiales sp. Tagirdzhanova-0007]